jgi:hypothetical protein
VRSRGERVHTSSSDASRRARLRSTMAASNSASVGVVGMSSSNVSSLTGDRLGGAGRRPTPAGVARGGGSARRARDPVRAPAVERGGRSGSRFGASPNFAPHLGHTGPSIHTPGSWLLQK